MPKENFWTETRTEGDQPDLTISWGEPHQGITINGHTFKDQTGINRLIRTLNRARRTNFPKH